MSMKVYLNGFLLPVAPENIKRKIKNGNKTVKLVNGEQVNIILPPGLTEFTLSDVLLPNNLYGFAEGLSYITRINTILREVNGSLSGKRVAASYYLDKLAKMKTEGKPVTLVINESTDGLCNDGPSTCVEVTVEDYTITQKTEEGNDIVVDIKLLQYIPYGLETIELTQTTTSETSKKKKKKKKTRTQKETEQQTYTVVKGDTLWAIAKKFYGDGNLYHYLAELNNLKNPNILNIGQVLKIGSAADAKAYKPKTESSSSSSSASSSSSGSSSSSSGSSKKKTETSPIELMKSFSADIAIYGIDTAYAKAMSNAPTSTESTASVNLELEEPIRLGYSKLPSAKDIAERAKQLGIE